jgi:hypothetical protein
LAEKLAIRFYQRLTSPNSALHCSLILHILGPLDPALGPSTDAWGYSRPDDGVPFVSRHDKIAGTHDDYSVFNRDLPGEKPNKVERKIRAFTFFLSTELAKLPSTKFSFRVHYTNPPFLSAMPMALSERLSAQLHFDVFLFKVWEFLHLIIFQIFPKTAKLTWCTNHGR